MDVASTLAIRSRFRFLMVFMSSSSSSSANVFRVTINAASGALSVLDALYSKSASVVMTGIPNPQIQVGRANISRSNKETSNPRICGRSSDVIISSIGLS